MAIKRVTRGAEIDLVFNVDQDYITAATEILLVVQEKNSSTAAFQKSLGDSEVVKVDNNTFRYTLSEADTLTLEEDKTYLVQAIVTHSGNKIPVNFTPESFYLRKRLAFT